MKNQPLLKIIFSLFTALFVFFLTTYSIAQLSPTSPALNFNVFVEQNFEVSQSESEGPVAIGNNLIIKGDYNVAIHNVGTYQKDGKSIALAVNNSVQYISGNSFKVLNNGYVKIGSCGNSKVWYQDQNNAYSPIRITKDQNYNSSPRIELNAHANSLNVGLNNSPACESPAINFSNAFVQLKTNSQLMKNCVSNTILKNANGALVNVNNLPNQVYIHLQEGANVLNLTGAQMNQLSTIVFNSAPTATKFLILNVDNQATNGIFNWNVYNSSGISHDNHSKYILYNFHNTTTLNIPSGAAVAGTIFAPYADIVKTGNSSNLNGQIIAKSYKQTGGGEIHYLKFEPLYGGCPLLPSVPTASASFSVTNATQCLNNNHFTFTNGSTGVGNITYAWDFGDGNTSTVSNPSKSYSSVGNYTVTLVVTDDNGSHTTTQNVVVNPIPVAQASVDNNSQYLTANVFHFSITNQDPNLTYSWDFDDNTTSIVQNPSKSYTSSGIYNVTVTATNTNGCFVILTIPVAVLSDNVGSGQNGGLESEPLGGLVAKRDFDRIKSNFNSEINYEKTPKFNHIQTKSDRLTLNDMIPQQLEVGDDLHVSSPLDLTQITTAKEVVSVDYVREGRAKAVVLGIKTFDKAYSHTKSICDRFKGANIQAIDTVEIDGSKFIQFVLKQSNGTLEYAIAFVVGEDLTRNSYTLQTNWLISEYEKDDIMYNFQVWSVNPYFSQKLVADILTNLKSFQTVDLVQSSNVPNAYVISGKRQMDNLQLTVLNRVSNAEAYIRFEERKNENSGISTLTIPLENLTVGKSEFNLPIKDGYEYQGYLYLNNVLVDEVYLADGNWGIDYNESLTEIVAFNIENSPNRIYHEDEYPMYRKMVLSATSTDYVSVYKAISPGTVPTNLEEYKSIRFFAKGKGRLDIKLTKESISSWKDQYHFEIELSEKGREYSISLNDFTSENSNALFNASDLKMIVFTMLAESSKDGKLNFEIDEVSFSKKSSVSLAGLQDMNISVYPNPTAGKFSTLFLSPSDQILTMKISDLSGRVLYSQEINAQFGHNIFDFEFNSLQKGIVLVSFENETSRYIATRVLIQ